MPGRPPPPPGFVYEDDLRRPKLAPNNGVPLFSARTGQEIPEYKPKVAPKPVPTKATGLAQRGWRETVGARAGIDPENEPAVQKWTGLLYPLVQAGATAMEGFNGAVNAGIAGGTQLVGNAIGARPSSTNRAAGSLVELANIGSLFAGNEAGAMGAGRGQAMLGRRAELARAPRLADWVAAVPPSPRRSIAADAPRLGSVRTSPPTAAMANDAPPAQQITGPRLIDRIDVQNRPTRMSDPLTDMQRMQAAQRLNPGDVLPLPANTVHSLEEAEGINRGQYPLVPAPNELDELGTRYLPSPRDATRELPKRGPVDLVTFMRSQGGLRDQGGTLTHMGLDNAPRDLDFARGENRFGKLVDNDNGLPLDEAARRAWQAGYLPGVDRPDINTFLDALGNTHRGTERRFLPDDLPEVEAFNAARDQRFRVEQARQEGAPLAEDRGRPVTMDDLARNSAPPHAYEDWAGDGPNIAGNVRLDLLDSPQNINRALAVTESHMGGFDAARRGQITQAQTQMLANDLGMTPDALLARRKGQAFNAEEALAARQILSKSGNELVTIAKRVQAMDNPGDDVLAAFRQAAVRHAAIQEQVSGATAEAGRSLAQFRMMADSRNVRGDVLEAIVRLGGGRDHLKDAADRILELEKEPGKLNSFVEKAVKPKWHNKLTELWYNSLLSGPQTHVVNMVSNTLTALGQIPEHIVASGIGAARNAVSREAVTDRVLGSEIGARSFGLLQGAKEGLAQAVKTFRTGEGSDFASKVEAIGPDAFPGMAGKVIRTPTRLLAAEDELFKGMARRMELNGLAVRQAHAEGLKGDAATARIAELISDPPDAMLEKSFDYGRYLTFQSKMGPIAQSATQLVNSVPVLGRLVVPFVRTPANLLKFAAERSPLAPLVDTWRADVRAGGARRDLAVAKATVGSGMGALVASMAADGHITGNGPADPQARQLLMADGWQPYSVKLGNKYYSYQRLDPFSTTFGVAADLVDLQQHMTDKQQEHVAALLTTSIMHNLASKTWLSGLSDALDAVNEPERKGAQFWNRLAGSIAVPTGVAQIARTVDPNLREAQTMLDSIRARIPVVSMGLQPRRDAWGQPIVKEGGLGPDLISPIWQSTRQNDPANNALIAAGVGFGKPSRFIGSGPNRATLPPAEFGRLQETAGGSAHNQIAALVQTPEWQWMSPEDQQKIVTDIQTRARKQARSNLFPLLLKDAKRLPPPPPGFVYEK